jgi:hypothetical protein
MDFDEIWYEKICSWRLPQNSFNFLQLVKQKSGPTVLQGGRDTGTI